MKNVLLIIKNNFYRVQEKKALLLTALFILPVMIACVVLFTSKTEKTLRVGYVGELPSHCVEVEHLKLTQLEEKPAMSDLMLGKFDAIVSSENESTYEVTMIKGTEYQEKLENYFNQGQAPDLSIMKKRGTGATIISMVTMFILMQGVALMTLYSDERKYKTIRRVLNTNVSIMEYLTAQGIFTFLFLYVPAAVSILGAKELFHVEMDYSNGMLLILLAVISALSTAFSLFIVSVIEKHDDGVMATGLIIIITSILSGSFYSFTMSNKIVEALLSLLPQKTFFAVADGIEKGARMSNYPLQLFYLVACIVVFWLLGCIVTKKKLSKGDY